MKDYRIAVIGGDGVGPEVVEAGMSVLDTAASGFRLNWEHLPWGSDYYQAHGVMMPDDGLEVLAGFDSIYLGAVGRPHVPDHVTLWGLLLPIRQRFDLYLNVRPVRLLPGVLSPLRDRGPADIGAVIQGGMGMAASANITPDRSKPGMFEPVHGSAPDITGTGRANPIGAVWAGAMMLDHLGESAASNAVLKAMAEVLATTKIRTPDLGGTATTSEVGQELERALRAARTAG